MNCSLTSSSPTWFNEDFSIAKKLAAITTIGGAADACLARIELRKFAAQFEAQRISGIVADFDDTIVDGGSKEAVISNELIHALTMLLDHGAVIGVASGRGGSGHRILRSCIEKKRWSQVVYGGLNGASVCRLDSGWSEPVEQDHAVAEIARVARSAALPTVRKVTNAATQISFYPATHLTSHELFPTIHALVAGLGLEDKLRIVVSSVSVDVTQSNVSKLEVVSAIRALPCFEGGTVITIGDSAGPNGNDAEMLSLPNSLCVGTPSASLETCWNVGLFNEVGPLAVLRLFRYLLRSGRERVAKK